MSLTFIKLRLAIDCCINARRHRLPSHTYAHTCTPIRTRHTRLQSGERGREGVRVRGASSLLSAGADIPFLRCVWLEAPSYPSSLPPPKKTLMCTHRQHTHTCLPPSFLLLLLLLLLLLPRTSPSAGGRYAVRLSSCCSAWMMRVTQKNEFHVWLLFRSVMMMLSLRRIPRGLTSPPSLLKKNIEVASISFFTSWRFCAK